MVNCIPVFIAREDYWNRRFDKAGLPIVGDDIKSQVGATIVHRTLARLFGDRGVKLAAHVAAQRGRQHGLLQHARARAAGVQEDLQDQRRHLDRRPRAGAGRTSTSARRTTCRGSTDRKWAHIRLEGQAFGDVPLTAELKLEVWDSPNSAGIVIDAVRCCKLALNHGIGGQLDGPSSYLMKSPYTQRPDHLAREATEEFIAHHARTRKAADAARAAADKAAEEKSAVVD